MLCDFHIHSRFSDGTFTIPELVDFYGVRGFGAIAITDHLCDRKSVIGRFARVLEHTITESTFPLYQAILASEKTRAWSQYGMVLIPGVELTRNSVDNHRSAHVLSIGTRAFLSADQSSIDQIKSIHDAGGIAVAAHPVSTRKIEKQTLHLWDQREELRSHLDAWEVASGPYVFDEVRRARLPMLASSDLHRPSQISSWKTRLFCERSETAILEAIRKQEVEFEFYDDHRSGAWNTRTYNFYR